ncbi:MAG: DUF4870 domain-containing protein [Archaeoglobaceae archaeon]
MEEKVAPEEKKVAPVAKPKTSTGLEENVEGLLCYLVGFITGIIFLIIEKESRFVRFHAMQSTVTFLTLAIVNWIIGAIIVATALNPFTWGITAILGIISTLILIASIIFWILGMYMAYRGQMYKFPFFGQIAENFLK